MLLRAAQNNVITKLRIFLQFCKVLTNFFCFFAKFFLFFLKKTLQKFGKFKKSPYLCSKETKMETLIPAITVFLLLLALLFQSISLKMANKTIDKLFNECQEKDCIIESQQKKVEESTQQLERVTKTLTETINKK